MNYINPILLSIETSEATTQFDWTAFTEYIFHSNVINSILVLFFLIWIFRKYSILSGIDNVRQAIVDEIERSETSKQDSEKTLEEKEVNYKQLDKEVIKIKETSKELASSIIKEIEEGTIEDIEEIEKKTKRIINAEESKTVKSVSANIVSAAVSIAQEHIVKSLDEDMQKEFIERFIDELDEVKL